MKPYCRDTWVEVNLDAIAANVRTFRGHLPASTSIMAVVKADGYGHGSVQVARAAIEAGAKSLAVAMLDEAIVLRKAGVTEPLLVLGFTPLDCIELAQKWNIQLTAYHSDWIREADALLKQNGQTSKPIGIHIKTDTGMGRLGVRTDAELLDVVHVLMQADQLDWVGIFTHFACADEPDTHHVLEQHERFMEMLHVLREAGYQLPMVHCCNSAAAIVFPQWGYDSIRLGISLYGLYPSGYLKERQDLPLVPALSLKTRITHVKASDAPFTVSYGATYTAQAGEQIATLPIGYADGFSRGLSGRGCALHNGRRVGIVGRVCMDQTMIRIDEGTARVGDEVVLYGKQGEEEISLDEVAALLGTINYE
ncbi:MAG: alanine racemase, partial [Clostridia bacterium]